MSKKLKNIIACGGIVENTKGEVLVIYRNDKWDLPKGKLEKGETMEQCALREVSEETGVQHIQIGYLITTTNHTYIDPLNKNTTIQKETYWYKMNISNKQDQLTPQIEEGITEVKWVSGEELKKCLENSYPSIVDLIKQANYLLPKTKSKNGDR